MKIPQPIAQRIISHTKMQQSYIVEDAKNKFEGHDILLVGFENFEKKILSKKIQIGKDQALFGFDSKILCLETGLATNMVFFSLDANNKLFYLPMQCAILCGIEYDLNFIGISNILFESPC